MAGGEETASAAEADMDLEFARGADVPSFEFAFNSEKFSDKVLQIEVVVGGDGEGGAPLPESVRPSKEQGDDGQSIVSSSMMTGTLVLREKSIYINSAILAARSPFFLKLFSNGMKESDQTHPKIRITDSEENALMELLSFMYSGKMTTTEPSLLLDILMAADKFEVVSCINHCTRLLKSLPMTTKSAVLYLDHPFSISLVAEVQYLIDAAKQFIVNKYKDLTEIPDELMDMSLAVIETIFSSTDLQIPYEDDVYDFLLKWACKHYHESEERKMIWNSRLLPLVRICHVSWMGLHNILKCADDDIDLEQTTKGHKQGSPTAEAATCWQVPQRAYRCKTLKVVEFDRSCPQVIVYLDLTRDECSRLFPSERICSHLFSLAGSDFYLCAGCEMDEESKLYSFGLWIAVESMNGSTGLTVDFELAARAISSGKFGLNGKGNFNLTNDSIMYGCDDLFNIPWSTFIDDDNLFIDEVLHLRADLTVPQQPELQT